MRKLAVIFPGIGYTMDRPLLYFCRKIAAGLGYEIKPLPYSGFPSNVRGDRNKLLLCYDLARTQAKELLTDADLPSYDDILFVGKSIGTAVAAELAAQSPLKNRIRQVLYTPLEDTFSVPIRDAVVFTGGNDPWAGGEHSRIPALCAERSLPCHVIPGANHSLETNIVETDLMNLRQVMEVTERYIRELEIREAQNGDLTEIASLHVSNQKSTYRGLLSDDYLDLLDPAEQLKKWERFSQQDGHRLFVARDRSGLLGFAACKADPEYRDCLYLDSLHTAPAARGQGIGTALIRRVGQHALEHGYQTMSVCIVKGNDRAKNLYIKMGAVHKKDFVDHFEGTTAHAVKLQWPNLHFGRI